MNDPTPKLPPLVRFLREAHRRRVFRVAGLYIVGSWLLLQGADVVFPGLDIPDVAIRYLLIAIVVGFPFALLFGWLFDVSAAGIVRTTPVNAGQEPEALELRRYDYFILVALAAVAVAILFGAIRGVVQSAAPPTSMSASLEALPKLDNSIAVLPFDNLGASSADEFFGSGVAEDILNTLTTFNDLNVIGRTSSFALKHEGYAVPQLCALLGVKFLLQGSVRRAESKVRVSAQLLDERGVQVWGESYDRELTDIFAIQSEIASQVATRVVPRIVPSMATIDVPGGAAYEHFLAGRTLLHKRLNIDAQTELERAIELDPGYAEAYAELAIVRVIGAPSDRDIELAQQAINAALELSPGLLRAHEARAIWLLQRTPPDPAQAEAVLRRVLAQDSNRSDALLWLYSAVSMQGRRDDATGILEQAYRLDPLHPSIFNSLVQRLVERGDWQGAERIARRRLEGPASAGPTRFLAGQYRVRGRLVDMHSVAKHEALARVADSYHRLALSYGLLGDFDSARYWAERTMRDFPRFEYAPIIGTYVDVWQGNYDAAASRFRALLPASDAVLHAASPIIIARYGEILALAGDFSAATEVLETMVLEDASTREGTSDATLALAFAFAHADRTADADRLLQNLDRALEHNADWAYVSADRTNAYLYALSAVQQGRKDEALDRLERAIDAGWREYYTEHKDPRWASVRTSPRFQTLMANVKTDVDRQRVEVEHIDAEDDFVRRLDAVWEERSGENLR